MSSLSCPGYHATAMMSSCFVLSVSCPGCHATAILSSFPVLTVLSRLIFPAVLFPALLPFLSCSSSPSCYVLAVLPVTFWLSCPLFPLSAVLSYLCCPVILLSCPVQAVLSWLSCSDRKVLPVLSQLSCIQLGCPSCHFLAVLFPDVLSCCFARRFLVLSTC